MKAIKKYKLRCRINGIVVTSRPEKYNIVWIREYNPEIYPMDRTITNRPGTNRAGH